MSATPAPAVYIRVKRIGATLHVRFEAHADGSVLETWLPGRPSVLLPHEVDRLRYRRQRIHAQAEAYFRYLAEQATASPSRPAAGDTDDMSERL